MTMADIEARLVANAARELLEAADPDVDAAVEAISNEQMLEELMQTLCASCNGRGYTYLPSGGPTEWETDTCATCRGTGKRA